MHDRRRWAGRWWREEGKFGDYRSLGHGDPDVVRRARRMKDTKLWKSELPS